MKTSFHIACFICLVLLAAPCWAAANKKPLAIPAGGEVLNGTWNMMVMGEPAKSDIRFVFDLQKGITIRTIPTQESEQRATIISLTKKEKGYLLLLTKTSNNTEEIAFIPKDNDTLHLIDPLSYKDLGLVLRRAKQ